MIFLNFSLVAMSSGVSPFCRRRRKRRQDSAWGRVIRFKLPAVMRFCTYVILDVSVGVSFQQQRNQAMTFPLTDVVKGCVPLLHTKHTTHWKHAVQSLRARLQKTRSADQQRPTNHSCPALLAQSGHNNHSMFAGYSGVTESGGNVRNESRLVEKYDNELLTAYFKGGRVN